jgi:hypothetical protein
MTRTLALSALLLVACGGSVGGTPDASVDLTRPAWDLVTPEPDPDDEGLPRQRRDPRQCDRDACGGPKDHKPKTLELHFEAYPDEVRTP